MARRRNPSLVFFINGHGFGHATRCLAVLDEIWRRRPDLPVVIRTDAPAFLFSRGCRGPYRLEAGEVDPGTLQPDPLRLDREGSVQARVRFHRGMDARIASERDRLSGAAVGLVVGDIPPLAFEVAAALGVRCAALGNFSWDWIYEPYVEDRPQDRWIVTTMRESYARADLLLRLPLHGCMDAFPHVEPIPHVVRPALQGREAVRRALGLHGERRPVVLVSFGGFAALRIPPPGGADPGPFRFVTFGEGMPGLPLDTVRLAVDHPHAHPDLLGAADAVITKPGYGTVAECLALRVPFLFTSRDDFREYDVLVEGIRSEARARFLPREDLLRCRLAGHLEALLSDRRPWGEVRADGASVAAERILQLFPA